MPLKVKQKVKLVNPAHMDASTWEDKIGVIVEVIYVGKDPTFICEFEGGVKLSLWPEELEEVHEFIPKIGLEGIKLLREAISNKDREELVELSNMLLNTIEDLQNELSAAYDTINERKE
jgi:coenzyme F420-reducing hydrogenase delta subunit